MHLQKVIVVQGWPEPVALENAHRLLEMIDREELQCVAASEWMATYKVLASDLSSSSVFIIDSQGATKFNGMMG